MFDLDAPELAAQFSGDLAQISLAVLPWRGSSTEVLLAALSEKINNIKELATDTLLAQFSGARLQLAFDGEPRFDTDGFMRMQARIIPAGAHAGPSLVPHYYPGRVQEEILVEPLFPINFDITQEFEERIQSRYMRGGNVAEFISDGTCSLEISVSESDLPYVRGIRTRMLFPNISDRFKFVENGLVSMRELDQNRDSRVKSDIFAILRDQVFLANYLERAFPTYAESLLGRESAWSGLLQANKIQIESSRVVPTGGRSKEDPSPHCIRVSTRILLPDRFPDPGQTIQDIAIDERSYFQAYQVMTSVDFGLDGEYLGCRLVSMGKRN